MPSSRRVLLPQDDTLHALLWNAHFYFAFAFFTLSVAHFAAALFHAPVLRNGVVEVMAPARSRTAGIPAR